MKYYILCVFIMNCLEYILSWLIFFFFFVNLTQTRLIWEEGTSVEKMLRHTGLQASLCTFSKGKTVFGNFLGVAEGAQIGLSAGNLLWCCCKEGGGGAGMGNQTGFWEWCWCHLSVKGFICTKRNCGKEHNRPIL